MPIRERICLGGARVRVAYRPVRCPVEVDARGEVGDIAVPYCCVELGGVDAEGGSGVGAD